MATGVAPQLGNAAEATWPMTIDVESAKFFGQALRELTAGENDSAVLFRQFAKPFLKFNGRRGGEFADFFLPRETHGKRVQGLVPHQQLPPIFLGQTILHEREIMVFVAAV